MYKLELSLSEPLPFTKQQRIKNYQITFSNMPICPLARKNEANNYFNIFLLVYCMVVGNTVVNLWNHNL